MPSSRRAAEVASAGGAIESGAAFSGEFSGHGAQFAVLLNSQN